MSHQRSEPAWRTVGGGPRSNTHCPSAEKVLNGLAQAPHIHEIWTRDPEAFVPGQLHQHVDEWLNILPGYSQDHLVQEWITNGVNALYFMKHFKGSFRGKSFDSDFPPNAIFPNSQSCQKFGNFIAVTLEDRIANGSLSVLGRIGSCELPKLIMPLTIEPNKPRLCHDERYLNLWTIDNPFKLETLREVPRMIEQDAHIFTLDDKSGYDHIRLTEECQTYFGVMFAGWVMVYKTLPFGWKSSAYVYQTTGMAATSYMREIGINNMQYIDDRLGVCNPGSCITPSALVYCVMEILVRLGYTIGLKKMFP